MLCLELTDQSHVFCDAVSWRKTGCEQSERDDDLHEDTTLQVSGTDLYSIFPDFARLHMSGDWSANGKSSRDKR
jgi:hypothetical protein